jgi:hypothetical protein
MGRGEISDSNYKFKRKGGTDQKIYRDREIMQTEIKGNL